jgi:hypothetical protein
LLITGSARIWKGTRVDTSAVIFTHFKHQPSGGFSGAVTSADAFSQFQSPKKPQKLDRNKPYGSEVLFSKFYYMDKFSVLVILRR